MSALPPRRPGSTLAARSGGALVAALGSRRTTIGLAIAAAIAAALIQHLVYPAFSWNRDEPVYLWQVELLRQGQLSGTDGGFPALFHPWLSAWRDGQFFTQYPLGWPVVILAGTWISWPGAAISAAAALAVSGVSALTHQMSGDRLLANVAGLVLLCSPIFAVQGGLYLNYLFTTGLGLWFLVLFLGAVRTRSPARAAAAAIPFGWIVCTRTFDAVLWGSVAVGYVAVVERGRWNQQLRTAAGFLAVVAPFVALQLVHNRTLTGSPFTFPITAKDPLDTFGFGHRRLMPAFESEGYGLRRAVISTVKHGFFLPWFLVGAYLGVAVAAITAWFHRRQPSTWLLVALIIVFPVGYFGFWGTYISSLTVRLSGPIYFVPLYAPLAILIATGVVQLARQRPRATMALVIVLAVITVPVTTGRLGLNRELSRAQVAWRDSVADLDEPAVVVVAATSYLLYLNPFSANTPDIDGDIIYATNSSPTVIDLLDAHPDREHLLQRSERPPEELLPSERPRRSRIVLEPMEVIEGEAVLVTARIVPPRDGERVWAHLVLGDDETWRSLTYDSEAGVPIETTWLLATSDSPASVRDDPDAVVLPRGHLTVSFGATFGAAPRRTRLTPFVFQRFHLRTLDGVEVLTPGPSFRGRERDDLPFPVRWDAVLDNPELSVEIDP